MCDQLLKKKEVSASRTLRLVHDAARLTPLYLPPFTAYKDSLDGRSTGKVGYEPRPSIKERCIIIHIEINWGNWGVWGQHVRWIDNGVLHLCFIAVFSQR